MTRPPRPPFLAAGWLACASAARAAGGHFDVDDAAVVEPGRCQYETWLVRAPAASATVFHLGPACRVGPLELGLNYDRASTPNGLRSSVGPQLKWIVDPLFGVFAAGLAWAAAHDLDRGGRPAHTLYVPVTWTASDRLSVNANLGADWDFTGQRDRRVGLSAEFAVHEKLTVIAERIRVAGDWTSRLGARVMLGEVISIDLSVARTGPNAIRSYVIGLNHDFAR